jgi:DNA-binding MarR family transcriptional regulator
MRVIPHMAEAHDDGAPDIEAQPGHLIRRLQQFAVALFMDETQGLDLTPVQFAALAAAQRQPGMDQRSLAAGIGFDTSTTGGVLDRLEGRGLIQRSTSPDDRRVRLINLTAAGADMLQTVTPRMLAAQQRILEPLPEAQRTAFMDMLGRLVRAHQDGRSSP